MRLVPWSWGHGVRLIPKERWVLGPIEDKAADIQEKVGAMLLSQAQGTEQITLLGRPDSRVSGMRMLGVWVRAGEERKEVRASWCVQPAPEFCHSGPHPSPKRKRACVFLFWHPIPWGFALSPYHTCHLQREHLILK